MPNAKDEVSIPLLALIACVLIFGGAAVKVYLGNPLLSVLAAGAIALAIFASYSFLRAIVEITQLTEPFLGMLIAAPAVVWLVIASAFNILNPNPNNDLFDGILSFPLSHAAGFLLLLSLFILYAEKIAIWHATTFFRFSEIPRFIYLALVGPIFVVKGALLRFNTERLNGSSVSGSSMFFSISSSFFLSLALSALAITFVWITLVAFYFALKFLLS